MFLLPAALAHVPHDLVSAVIAAPGEPWLALANPGRQSLLLTSEDEGDTWNLVGGAPTAEALVAAARAEDGAWLLLGEAHLWRTTDHGESWTIHALPGDVDQLAVDGADLVLAGPAGVWTGPASGPWTAIGRPAEAVSLLSTGAFTYADGGVWSRVGGWHEVPSPGPPTISATVVSGTLYAAAGAGQVWARVDGAWAACTPIAGASDWLRLFTRDETLYVTSDTHAAWRSMDGCTTWEHLAAPLDAEYGVSGGVEDEAEAFPVVEVAGDRVVIAGWAGLATWDGASWRTATILPAGYTRGLVVSPLFPSNGEIWWGTYAGGIARTDDAGASWSAPNLGTLDPNIQALALDRDGATLYAISGHIVRRSTDHGRVWDTLQTGFTADESVIIWQDPGHVWVTGRTSGGIESTQVRETLDFGDTWREVGALSAFIPGADARAVTRVLDTVCVSTSDRSLACSDDAGVSWDTRFNADTDLADPVGWPKDGPQRILVIDDAGVHLSDDAGRTWTVVTVDPLDPPATLTGAPDDSLFLLTASGRLWRSADGGDSWGPTGVRLPADTFHLVPRPDFYAVPELIAGTADGLYRIEDATGTPRLSRWAAWERVEASGTEFGVCTTCPDPRDWPGAGSVDVQPLDTGAAWETTMRGDRLRLYGATLGVGSVVMEVDGVEVARVDDLWDPHVDLRAEVDVAPAPWHHVRLTGRNFLVDAVEAESDLSPLDGVDLGCASTPASAGWIGLIAATFALRRRVTARRVGGMLERRSARRCG